MNFILSGMASINLTEALICSEEVNSAHLDPHEKHVHGLVTDNVRERVLGVKKLC